MFIGKRDTLILLDRNLLLAQGKFRECYFHPDDKTKIIKIAKKRGLLKSDGNQMEWKHYRLLEKRFMNIDFLIKCHGFIETNLGKGLVFDCLRDGSGKLSKTLNDIFTGSDTGYDLKKIFSEVDSFCDFIMKHHIQLFDINLCNIAIKIFSDGRYKAFAVDIKGRYANHEFIPISSYIPFLSRRKLKRRILQLKSRMADRSKNLKL